MRRHLATVVAGLTLMLAFAATSVVANAGPLASTCAAAAGGYHAAVLVEHSDGAVVGRCVAITSGSINAEDLLTASGIEFQTSGSYSGGGLGSAICQVDNEPATYPPDCFSNGSYWEVLTASNGGAWQASARGVSSLTIQSGDALGLHYVAESGAPSDPASPWGICAHFTQAPSPTAPSTARTAESPRNGASSRVSAATPRASAAAHSVPASPAVTGGIQAISTVAAAAPPTGPSTGVNMAALLTAIMAGALVGALVLRITVGRRA